MTSPDISRTDNEIHPDNSRQLMSEPFYWKESGGLKLLVSRRLEEAGFVSGFSTRIGGVSPFPDGDLNLAGFGDDSEENIAENRRRFLRFFGGRYDIATAWQVHGDGVLGIESPADSGDNDEKADAVMSDLPAVLAGVKTADCVPILIGDPANGAFAAVHAGWRGTLKRIAEKAVGAMRSRYGSDPESLIAAVGPGACGREYEVGPEVVEAFRAEFSTSGKLLSDTGGGHALIDLHLANKEQLKGAGIRDENISVAPYCTMERPDLFFSYRIDRNLYGRTGRLMSVIGRR